ncbi:two-component system phosphate regulon sensor histidine kinase PhoR [Kordia periserrulae]|uniref:histidine kinase n=1 Tax=Kordia periserrulae TaxID=701523 RepID=A0A2T6BUI1_9FLAO|nr:HAMP domain-containing sensor histidine kinase [Kordia periserrulae]PTX59722.1 two-component system phosphate regulon sensor histidine kinase PhoR [Kordia periserrulae]
MSKRLFIVLVILMSLSLIGIIFVQGYWIATGVEDKQESFSLNANQILKSVSEKVTEYQDRKYYLRFQKLIDSVGEPKDSQVLNVFLIQSSDEKNNETSIYTRGIIEEDFNIFPTFIDSASEDDSTSIKNFKVVETRVTFREDMLDNTDFKLTPVQKFKKVNSISKKMAQFKEIINELTKQIPIDERVNTDLLSYLIQGYLDEFNLDMDFEFGVYDDELATKIKSDGFKITNDGMYNVPLFEDEDKESGYTLYVSFPKRNKYVLSSIMGMAIMSIVFTLIIIIAYSSALYQLIKQKQISEIKTDFINNMTHEFKTPIATINLALDAVRNPKIIDDKEKVKRYLRMIREENKRMHAQVENVLRISKLEKNQLDISKDAIDVHDLIEDALSHIELIVEDRKGYVKTQLNAKHSMVMANDTHFTNVLVNILDNAIKYTEGEPKIDVFTEVVKNSIQIKIKDQGQGMSKSVQKRIFEKFYREHTGDIHNVKGHGLGLAYVKRIVDDHGGQISVESEKGKGSTFIIKLPLIS